MANPLEKLSAYLRRVATDFNLDDDQPMRQRFGRDDIKRVDLKRRRIRKPTGGEFYRYLRQGDIPAWRARKEKRRLEILQKPNITEQDKFEYDYLAGLKTREDARDDKYKAVTDDIKKTRIANWHRHVDRSAQQSQGGNHPGAIFSALAAILSQFFSLALPWSKYNRDIRSAMRDIYGTGYKEEKAESEIRFRPGNPQPEPAPEPGPSPPGNNLKFGPSNPGPNGPNNNGPNTGNSGGARIWPDTAYARSTLTGAMSAARAAAIAAFVGAAALVARHKTAAANVVPPSVSTPSQVATRTIPVTATPPAAALPKPTVPMVDEALGRIVSTSMMGVNPGERHANIHSGIASLKAQIIEDRDAAEAKSGDKDKERDAAGNGSSRKPIFAAVSERANAIKNGTTVKRTVKSRGKSGDSRSAKPEVAVAAEPAARRGSGASPARMFPAPGMGNG